VDSSIGVECPEKITIFKCNGHIIGLSPVHDYIFRPAEFYSMSLYDWISGHQHEKRKPVNKRGPVQNVAAADAGSDDGSSTGHNDRDSAKHGPVRNSAQNSRSKIHNYLSGHLLAETHGAHWSKKVQIPNFVGDTLPHCDQGDHEYYCCTMLTLFKPWRSGLDLKNEGLWDKTFLSHQFSPCHVDLMKNMNLRYECLDARDDFHAQMQKGAVATPSWAEKEAGIFQDLDQMAIEDAINGPLDGKTVLDDFSISAQVGK
jgi:hypothetical protein